MVVAKATCTAVPAARLKHKIGSQLEADGDGHAERDGQADRWIQPRHIAKRVADERDHHPTGL